MAGIEETRAGIANANDKTREGIASLEHAITCFGEAEQTLATATRGTSQDEILQAHGRLREASELIRPIQNSVTMSIEETQAYADRL